jgi:hypothetical protein
LERKRKGIVEGDAILVLHFALKRGIEGGKM